MTSGEDSIRRFFDGWDRYNDQITPVVRDLTPGQLQVRPAPDHWPLWATLGHMARARVYWLCGVIGELPQIDLWPPVPVSPAG